MGARVLDGRSIAVRARASRRRRELSIVVRTRFHAIFEQHTDGMGATGQTAPRSARLESTSPETNPRPWTVSVARRTVSGAAARSVDQRRECVALPTHDPGEQ